MRSVRELVQDWQAKAHKKQATKALSVPLTLHDAARIRALTELYPGLII